MGHLGLRGGSGFSSASHASSAIRSWLILLLFAAAFAIASVFGAIFGVEQIKFLVGA